MSRRKHSSYKRYNRKEFLRRRKSWVIAAVVLVVILITCGVLLFMHVRSKRTTVIYSQVEECTLPTLKMMYDGEPINRIFGYADEMNPKYMRDTIYVLDNDFDIEVRGELYGNTVKSMEFTVTDMENQRLIQTTKVTEISTSGDTMRAILHIENLIEEDREYFADIKLVDGKNRTLHYYTRIIRNTTSPLKAVMDMVKEHHNAMYIKTDSGIIEEHQAPNSAVNDSTNFGEISISSTVNSMTWGTMGVHVITEPVISIVDLDNDIAFFRLDYQVGRTSEEGIDEYYNVSEYYKTRTYGTKKYILSYERSVNQIFVPDRSFVGNKSLLVGIEKDINLQTMTDSSGNRIVFVADKAVWLLNSETKTLQKVFSFEKVPTDIRQNYNQHDIKLLKITDQGDFQFLVYGYMNSGLHEGVTGIGLYTYSSEKNEVTEDIFIHSKLPYQVLKNSIGSLCYLNNNGILYILLDEFVYALDSNANRANLVVRGLNENNYKTTVNGRMIAWQDGGSENKATRINVLDAETEETYSVNAPEGKAIKVLGFLDNDLVYGEGEMGHTYSTADGEIYLLMEDLYVVNNKQEVQTSEHSSSGYFTTSVVEYNRVVVDRTVRVGNEYRKGDEFTLFATDIEEHPAASVYNIYDEDRRTINYIETVHPMDSNKTAIINDNMKITLCSAEATDVGDMISDEGKYYVYVAGDIQAICTSPSEAIMKAYYSTGVVITADGYFYKRASRPNEIELTNTSIRNAVEAYRSGKALNITGIYLAQALYYTGHKIPVIWEKYDKTYIIYGYDLFDNLMLYDIDTGEELLVAYEDVDDVFDITGRCFIYTR